MRKGECIFCNISDVEVDFKKYNQLIETYCEFPSKVFGTEAEIERVKNYIVDNIKMFNFEDGMFNADFIATDFGLKIIDFNPRAPGWYYNAYTKKATGICTYKVDLVVNTHTIFIPLSVPYYFALQGISYVDPKETEGFVSEHESEISTFKYYIDEKLSFKKIIVYKKE